MMSDQHIDLEGRSDQSLGELFKEMTSDVSTLFRKEVELAKVELKEEATKAGKAGGMFAGAGAAAWMGLTFLSFALAWGLDAAMPRWLAFFIVGAIYVAVAAVLFVRARNNAKTIKPVPEQTVETLKEDVQWAKAQRS